MPRLRHSARQIDDLLDVIEKKCPFGTNSPTNCDPDLQEGFDGNAGTMLDSGLTMVKLFDNGVWLGNHNPAERTGSYYAQEGDVGLFVSVEEQMAYIVTGTSMAPILAGDAVARFG